MKLLGYYLADCILGHLFPGDYFPSPLVIGIALSREDPAPSGYYLNEPPTDYNYSRAATYASWWTHDGVATMYNSTAIVFNEAIGGSWGNITHFALFDSANYGAGNMLFYGELLGGPKLISEGCIARFEIGALIANMM